MFTVIAPANDVGVAEPSPTVTGRAPVMTLAVPMVSVPPPPPKTYALFAGVKVAPLKVAAPTAPTATPVNPAAFRSSALALLAAKATTPLDAGAIRPRKA